MARLASSHTFGKRRQQCQLSTRANVHQSCTSPVGWAFSIILIFPALLVLISSSKTVPAAFSLPVTSAFAPQHSGISRTKNSRHSTFLQASITENSISADDNSISQQEQQTSTPASSDKGDRPRVEVWDGVFSRKVCEYLHELAIDHSERTTGEEEEDNEEEDEDDEEDDSLEGSSIFYHRGRNRSENDQLTPIEQALDSFLTAYYDRKSENGGDDDPNREVVVEYWCRQEHLNLEAHADVDEVLFERSCKTKANTSHPEFRYPTMGHVLYLTKPTVGLGPTCVFPPNDAKDRDASIKDEIESVVTIPAVPGRVLRFPGSALHGVPKPADVWFNTQKDEDVDSADDLDGEWDENYHDDDDDDDDDERSVILFNTWERNQDDVVGDNPVGPIGVPLDPMFHINSDVGIVDMMMSSVDMEDMMMSSVDMEGVEVDEDFVKGMVEYAKQQKNEQLKDWYDKYCDDQGTTIEGDSTKLEGVEDQPIIYSKVFCQPIESWKLAEINSGSHDPSNKEKGVIRVPLMGDETRRRYPRKKACWTVSSSFESGVKESEKPCKFSLQ